MILSTIVLIQLAIIAFLLCKLDDKNILINSNESTIKFASEEILDLKKQVEYFEQELEKKICLIECYEEDLRKCKRNIGLQEIEMESCGYITTNQK